MSDTDLRNQARKRLKAKRQFWEFVGTWAVVGIVLTAIWWVTSNGHGYFWPIWPIVGMGIAALFIGLDAYGPGRRAITEADIDSEVAKMTRGRSDPH